VQNRHWKDIRQNQNAIQTGKMMNVAGQRHVLSTFFPAPVFLPLPAPSLILQDTNVEAMKATKKHFANLFIPGPPHFISADSTTVLNGPKGFSDTATA
jgi:hypothetical protein